MVSDGHALREGQTSSWNELAAATWRHRTRRYHRQTQFEVAVLRSKLQSRVQYTRLLPSQIWLDDCDLLWGVVRKLDETLAVKGLARFVRWRALELCSQDTVLQEHLLVFSLLLLGFGFATALLRLSLRRSGQSLRGDELFCLSCRSCTRLLRWHCLLPSSTRVRDYLVFHGVLELLLRLCTVIELPLHLLQHIGLVLEYRRVQRLTLDRLLLLPGSGGAGSLEGQVHALKYERVAVHGGLRFGSLLSLPITRSKS